MKINEIKLHSKSIEVDDNSLINNKITIGFQLLKILKLTRKFIDTEMKELKISRIGWQVLFWMSILGPCSQKELLQNLDIDAGYLARVLEGFEKNGYIIRTPIQGNRRSLFIQMTEYGTQFLMPHIQAIIDKESAILLNGINDKDKIFFIELLTKLEINMQNALDAYNASSG